LVSDRVEHGKARCHHPLISLSAPSLLLCISLNMIALMAPLPFLVKSELARWTHRSFASLP
jgi:hypothetical protein